MALTVILLVAFSLPSLIPAVEDASCGLKATDGKETFAFEPTKLSDGEFSLSFKVLANSDVKIVLSPEMAIADSAYIITIGDANVATTIKKQAGEVLKTEPVSSDGSHQTEFKCYIYDMSGYWICFKNNMISLGRSGNSSPYFEYNVPVDEAFDPNYFGYATGGDNVGIFGDFQYRSTCKDKPQGSDLVFTTRQPRECRRPDCSAVFCPWGFKTDSAGCQTCDCKETPCDPLSCNTVCQHGYQRDELGCETCTCIPGACDDKPCLHGGYCYGTGDGQYGCACAEGFADINCSKDVKDPEITCPGDEMVNTDMNMPTASVTYAPATATDNSNAEPTILCRPSTPTLPIGANNIQCIATDDSANTNSCTYKITVEDKQPPTPACPISMEGLTDKGEAFTLLAYTLPTVEDNADPNPSISCTPEPNTRFPIGETTVSCTAQDKYNNEATCSFPVTVKDEEAPEFYCSLKRMDAGISNPIVTYTVPSTAKDNVDGEVEVICLPPSGTAFSMGSTDVTCTATDLSGNAKACPFTVLVEDDKPPDIKCPVDMTDSMDLGKSDGSVDYDEPTATDNSDPKPTVSCDPMPQSVFQAGPNEVTCKAQDSKGNAATCTFTITVEDKEKPKLVCPTAMTLPTDAEKSYTTVAYTTPTASDNFDDKPTVSCTPVSGSQIEVGEASITCTATDSADNTQSCSIPVTVQDKQPPDFDPPADMPSVSVDKGQDFATVNYIEPTATDNVDANPSVTCKPPSGSTFPMATTTVVCTSVDKAGNPKTRSFGVTVKDDEKPKMVGIPGDMDIPMDKDKPTATLTYETPSAEDNADPKPAVSCSPLSGTEIGEGDTTVTCTATDVNDNEEKGQFTVTVTDKQGPDMKCPIEMTEPLDNGFPYATVEYKLPIPDDNADLSPSVSCTPNTGATFQLGPTQVTCTATDNKANSNSCSFIITVEDNQGPTIECPLPMPKPADTGSRSTTVEYEAPKAKDNSGKVPTISCTPESGSVFSFGSTDVTCKASDHVGNKNSCTFQVVVTDKEKPKIVCPLPMPDETTDANSPTATVSYVVPTATDNVDTAIQVNCNPTSGSEMQIGANGVTCTAKDSSENKETCSFVITVKDEEKPGITCPAAMNGISVGIDEATTIVSYELPKATDNSGSNPTVTCKPASGVAYGIGTTEVICTATDGSANSKACTFRIEVTDDQKPKIVCPEPMTPAMVEGEPHAFANYLVPSATDNSNTAVTVTCIPSPGSKFLVGTHSVECTATDKYGNKETCSIPVTVGDEEGPKFDCPLPMPDETTDINSPFAIVDYVIPTAKDNVDGNVPVSCKPGPGSSFQVGVNKVICTSVDSAGNKKTCPFNINVKDNGPPKVTCPVDMTDMSVDTDQSYATVNYVVAATDEVDASPSVICDPPSPSQFQIGETKVTCTASDAAGNDAACSFTVTVKDEDPPEITCPVPMSQFASLGEKSAPVDYDVPVATDTADANPTVDCSPMSGTLFPMGSTDVTCTATDSSDNKKSCKFLITVNDNEKPKMTCPDGMLRTINRGKLFATVDYVLPVATDNADPSPLVSCQPLPGFQFPLGDTTVTCTATDKEKNKEDCTFRVTVTDNEGPKFTCPADRTMSLDGGENFATVTYTKPAATDNVDANPIVTCLPESGEKNPMGVMEITCSSTDSSNNKNTCKFIVRVEDKEKPTFQLTPVEPQVADKDKSYTIVDYLVPTAVDNVDPSPTVICVPPPGNQFFVGDTTVTCTATDDSGNKNIATFDVVVKDEQAPNFDCPLKMSKTLDDDQSSIIINYVVPTVTDNADANIKVTCNPPPGSTFQVGSVDVTCTATDSNGNTKSCKFIVEVKDETAPNFEIPPPIYKTLDEGDSSAIIIYKEPTATDNVDGDVKVTCNPPPSSTFQVGSVDVTCTATDSSGNTKSDSFTVEVKDEEAPKFECPIPMLKTLGDDQPSALINYELSTATDNVDGDIKVTCNPPSGSTFQVGRIDVTCSATDSSGNTKTCKFPIEVKDETAPMFTCPIPMLKSLDAGEISTVINYNVPTATDNVDSDVQVTCNPPSGSTFQVGSVDVTCIAKDSSSNTKSCSFSVFVKAPCKFVTKTNDYNYYPECATPLTPDGRYKICFKLESARSYNLYLSIWDKQSGLAMQPGMIDIDIDNNKGIAVGPVDFPNTPMDIDGFNDATGQMCISRDGTTIVITGNDVPLWTSQTESDVTEVGFASSLTADWIAESFYKSEGNSRRRRSLQVNENEWESAMKKVVSRRKRRSADLISKMKGRQR